LGRPSIVSTADQLTLASVSSCGSADDVARRDRWSSFRQLAARSRSCLVALEAGAAEDVCFGVFEHRRDLP